MIAVGSVVAQESIVRKTQFPRLVIPLAVVLTSLFNLLLNLVVVVIFILAFGVTPTWTWLLFPVVLALLMALTIAVSMIVSALFPRFRDIQIIWARARDRAVLRHADPVHGGLAVGPPDTPSPDTPESTRADLRAGPQVGDSAERAGTGGGRRRLPPAPRAAGDRGRGVCVGGVAVQPRGAPDRGATLDCAADVDATGTEFDPYLNDPLRWGASMAHHAGLMCACLDAVEARVVAEVGAYAGDLTRVLVDWADHSGARVVAIDPSPQDQLVTLATEHDRLELIRQASLDALPAISMPDVAVIDGDHNYYTVEHELRLIADRAPGAGLPLLMFHDVCWPHGRRDDYFDPAQIPAGYRQPIVGDGAGIAPGDPGVRPDGLPYPRSAAREGGERNGVLTAVEDFVVSDDALRIVVVPAFFGFGVVWHGDAPWADRVSRLLDPYAANPLLARLESNRVLHIAREHALRVELWRERESRARQERVLRRILESSAFGVAERLSRLRVRIGIAPDQSAVSREEVRRALEERPGT